MIAHFPPRRIFIYARLPHEMVVSNVVSLRCSLARLLVPHAGLHTSGLINPNPGGKRFPDQIGEAAGVRPTGKRESSVSDAGKLAQLGPVAGKAAGAAIGRAGQPLRSGSPASFKLPTSFAATAPGFTGCSGAGLAASSSQVVRHQVHLPAPQPHQRQSVTSCELLLSADPPTS